MTFWKTSKLFRHCTSHATVLEVHYLQLTIDQPPVQQRVVNKRLKHSHDAVFVSTKNTHHTLASHSVITIDASHLKRRKKQRTAVTGLIVKIKMAKHPQASQTHAIRRQILRNFTLFKSELDGKLQGCPLAFSAELRSVRSSEFLARLSVQWLSFLKQ